MLSVISYKRKLICFRRVITSKIKQLPGDENNIKGLYTIKNAATLINKKYNHCNNTIFFI